MRWGFFKKNLPGDLYNMEYINETLAALENGNDLARIPMAFPFLLTSSKDLQIRASTALFESVSRLSIMQLTRLDELFRERSSLDWSYDWVNESPENLLLSMVSEEEKATILGLSTFHPNGFFREKALDMLAQTSSGNELPYLILRCNDWVAEVRKKAKKYIENRMVSNYTEHLVHNLPLFFKLNKGLRDNHGILFDKVVKLLSQREAIPYLEYGAKSDVAQIRLFSYRIMIYSKMFSKKMLLNYLQREPQPHSRLFLFNEFVSDISKVEFDEYYPVLKKDKIPKIRAKVLELYCSFHPDHSKSELEKALFDKSGLIRSLARFFLKKFGIIEFASYYVEEIIQSSDVIHRGALLGLGETGTKQHVNLLFPFLKNNIVGIVKAAMRAIAFLDVDNNKNIFIEMLENEHKGVSSEAKNALQSTYYQDMKDVLCSIYSNSDYEHTKYNVAILLCSLPKWDAIRYIVEFYVNKNEPRIYELGKSSFYKWINRFNQSFETPTEEQINSIKRTLDKFADELNQTDKKEIEFYLK